MVLLEGSKFAELEKMINKDLLGVNSIISIDQEDGVGKGENYASVITRLKVKCLNQNGSTVERSFVLKKELNLSTKEDYQSAIFATEIKMYSNILPQMKKVLDEVTSSKKEKKMEILWALYYGNNAIILQDLKECGYSMRNRRCAMDGDTAIFIASQLAKFHALSIAAINRKLIDPLQLDAYFYTQNLPVVYILWSGGLKKLADSLASHPQWSYVVPKLRDLASNCSKLVQDLKKDIDVQSNMMVICHGDCWSNNCLFQFSEDSSKPTAIKFVDYQASHYGSFAWDLTYLMNTSMSAKCKESSYKSIMESYRSNLVETLKLLGQDVDQVPPIDTMYSIMDKLNLFGMILAFTFLPLTINTLEEPWHVEKALENSQDAQLSKIYENPSFKESLYIDLVKFKSQGLL